MEHSWEFRSVTDTDEIINAGLCAQQVIIDGVNLVGPQNGWVVRFMEVSQNEEDSGVTVTCYMERESFVSATYGWDGRQIA